jgi:hypothetical protein
MVGNLFAVKGADRCHSAIIGEEFQVVGSGGEFSLVGSGRATHFGTGDTLDESSPRGGLNFNSASTLTPGSEAPKPPGYSPFAHPSTGRPGSHE